MGQSRHRPRSRNKTHLESVVMMLSRWSGAFRPKVPCPRGGLPAGDTRVDLGGMGNLRRSEDAVQIGLLPNSPMSISPST